MSAADMTRPSGAWKFVTASDSADLPDGPCRALWVGTAGNARMVDASGNDTGGTNLFPLKEGANPIQARRIYSTGLTASNIWALY